MPTPLKKELKAYCVKEDKLMILISDKFGFEWPEKGTVKEVELKRADNQLLADEKQVVMGCEPKAWPNVLPAKNSDRIQCWSPGEAKEQFLKRFKELTI